MGIFSCSNENVNPFSAALAQVRHIIYLKGLESEFDVVSPAELGGLGSEQYTALNPQVLGTSVYDSAACLTCSPASSKEAVPLPQLTAATVLPPSCYYPGQDAAPPAAQRPVAA